MRPKPTATKRKQVADPADSEEETFSKSSDSNAKRVRWNAEVEVAESVAEEESDSEGLSQDKVSTLRVDAMCRLERISAGVPRRNMPIVSSLPLLKNDTPNFM